jgi:hypothetical protein
VTRFEDVHIVLGDPARFSNARLAASQAGNLLALDPPEHGRQRRLLRPDFAVRQSAGWSRGLPRSSPITWTSWLECSPPERLFDTGSSQRGMMSAVWVAPVGAGIEPAWPRPARSNDAMNGF